jgi:hypothetical protein
MAGIRLLYAPDKGAAAARLAEGLRAEGFAPELREVTADTLAGVLTAEASRADALLLIWSRPLVTHQLADEILREVRRQPHMIEVSADGIEPPAPGEDSPVVLLSGWRGQAFHPGWQRIQAEIKRLAGPGTTAPPPAAAGRKAGSSPPPAAAAGRPARARRRHALAAFAAAGLLGTALAATSFLAPAAPDGGKTAAGAPATPAAPAPPQVREAASPAAAGAAMPSSQGGATAAAPPALAPGAAPATRTPEIKAEQRRPLAAGKPAPSAPSAAAPQRPAIRGAAGAAPARAAPATKRFSRKNSKVMRRFCQRSGRGTTQCRDFLRSTESRPR